MRTLWPEIELYLRLLSLRLTDLYLEHFPFYISSLFVLINL